MSSTVRTIGAAIVIAAILATVIWVVARATGDDLRVRTPGSAGVEEMQVWAPAFATLFYGVVGAGVVWLLRRWANGRTIFLVVAVVVLALEAIQAFAATDSTGTAIWLNVMHLAAAAAIVPGYLRTFARPT